MRDSRSKLSKNNGVAEAMDYMLKAWPAFAAFLDDGHICLTNNAAERALRGIAPGQKIMALRRFRSWWPAHRLHAEPYRHGKAQRHRSAGLARQRPRAHRRHPPEPSPRTAAMELARSRRSTRSRLIRGLNRMPTMFSRLPASTIWRVTSMS